MKKAMKEIAEMASTIYKLEVDPNYPKEGDSGRHSKSELHAKRCAYIDALCIVAKHAGVSEDDAINMLDLPADEPEEDAENPIECELCPQSLDPKDDIQCPRCKLPFCAEHRYSVAHESECPRDADSPEEPTDEPPGCPVCSGPGVPLGALGHTEHFKCRDCGIQYGRVSYDTEATSEKTTATGS